MKLVIFFFYDCLSSIVLHVSPSCVLLYFLSASNWAASFHASHQQFQNEKK